MSEPTESHGPQPLISPRYVPLVLVLVSACQILGAAFALPGPWSAERVFMVTSSLLNLLVGGVSAGVHRHPARRHSDSSADVGPVI